MRDGIAWDSFLQSLISSLAAKRLYSYAIDAALLWLSTSSAPTLEHIKYVLKFAIERKSEVRVTAPRNERTEQDLYQDTKKIWNR